MKNNLRYIITWKGGHDSCQKIEIIKWNIKCRLRLGGGHRHSQYSILGVISIIYISGLPALACGADTGSQKTWSDCSRLWFIDTQHCVYITKHQLVNLCCSETWNWNLFEDIQFIITIILCRPIYRYHWCSRMDVLICKQGFGVGQCFEEKHWIPTQGIYHFNIHISHIHMSDKLMCLNGVGAI